MMARQIAVWIANVDRRTVRSRVAGASARAPTPRPLSLRDHDVLRRPPAPEHRAERQRGDHDEDTEPQERVSPARRLVEVSKQRRPDGAADTLPGGDHADREAGPMPEPAHHVDGQRTVDGCVPEQPEHHAEDEVELPPRVDRADEHCAGTDHGQAEQGHRSRSGAVVPPAHDDAADPGTGEEQRVGEGGHGARPAEIARHLLQAHHQQEHRAVGGHRQVGGDDEHRDGEGSPLRSGVGCARASHLGPRLPGPPCYQLVRADRRSDACSARSHRGPKRALTPSSALREDSVPSASAANSGSSTRSPVRLFQ